MCSYVDELSGGNGVDVIWHEVPATRIITYMDSLDDTTFDTPYCKYHYLIRARQHRGLIVSVKEIKDETVKTND